MGCGLWAVLLCCSCSVSRKAVSTSEVHEAQSSSHIAQSQTFSLDSLREDLNIQLDSAEIMLFEPDEGSGQLEVGDGQPKAQSPKPIAIIKAQKMALSKRTEASQSLQQIQLVRDTVYVERVVENSAAEHIEQESAAEPPDFTLIIIVCFSVLLIAVFLHRKLSG